MGVEQSGLRGLVDGEEVVGETELSGLLNQLVVWHWDIAGGSHFNFIINWLN